MRRICFSFSTNDSLRSGISISYSYTMKLSYCVVEGREVTVGKEKMVVRDRGLTGLSKKVHFTVEFSRELLAKDHLIAK